MFADLTKRSPRRRLVLEFTPHQVLAAELSRPHRGRLEVESAEEFDRDDVESLRIWLQSRAWTRVVCGIVPRRGIVQRETIDLRRLGEPTYLADLVEEQQRGRFLTATPFKVVNPEAWSLRIVSATDGTAIAANGEASAPALICGVANDELLDVQQRLVDDRLVPERIEAGLLSLFSALYGHMERRGGLRAVAVVVLQEAFSAVYILGKDGVHTPTPIFHGVGSIVELARKELNVRDDGEARRLMEAADPNVLKFADRLVRRVARDLKPVMDSYEMSTGQPLDEVFCAYLPPKLAWLSEPLARVTGRVPMAINCNEWLTTARLQMPHSASFGTQWLGALNLMASLHEGSATVNGVEGTHRPWHVPFEAPALAAARLASSRRLARTVVVVSLLVVALAATSWQFYVNGTLNSDLRYWEQEITQNRRLFDQLTEDNARLQSQSDTLRRAHGLMAMPFQPTDFIVELGRTVPSRMRIDRIETADTRCTISGSLVEPAEEATATLGRYMEELRQSKAIGRHFSNIAITSLQRQPEGDAVTFEITLRLNLPTP